jgi:hypothetical protein
MTGPTVAPAHIWARTFSSRLPGAHVLEFENLRAQINIVAVR